MIAMRILIVIALQTVALGYMIADRQAMLNSSRVVTLKVVPVDPRELFRGDYVILTYAISNLDLTKLDGDDNLRYGDQAFVTLAQQNGEWVPVAVGKNRVVPVQGGVAIRGSVTDANFDGDQATAPATSARVTYGIESYFVPQGTGHAIENEARQGELSVDAAIGDDGRAAIKAIRRNGTVFYVDGVF